MTSYKGMDEDRMRIEALSEGVRAALDYLRDLASVAGDDSAEALLVAQLERLLSGEPRPLTNFEIEHGYKPCPWEFNVSPCRSPLPGPCSKTTEDCRRLGALPYFGGMPLSPEEFARAQRERARRRLNGE